MSCEGKSIRPEVCFSAQWVMRQFLFLLFRHFSNTKMFIHAQKYDE